MTKLTVSKVAEQVGTSTDTLRYYERIGLLPVADRSPSGYRLYDAEAVEPDRSISMVPERATTSGFGGDCGREAPATGDEPAAQVTRAGSTSAEVAKRAGAPPAEVGASD
ncbi:MAG TPA: MerR family DNA-binding transcriptional regulator [Acidimicrobiales bacterium]|nr:MerR family DNA-binding transcriptional regulator [Acidimicrobiales bacterium]